MRRFFDLILGETQGYFILVIATGQYFNDNGKYSHESWREIPYLWPDQRDELIELTLDESDDGADIYFTPLLRTQPDRSQDTPHLPGRWVRCDADATGRAGAPVLFPYTCSQAQAQAGGRQLSPECCRPVERRAGVPDGTPQSVVLMNPPLSVGS
jgi:hypothetical protein